MIIIIVFIIITDAKKQTQMAALSKERDNLQSAIKTYKSLFETTEQLIEELKSKNLTTCNICFNIYTPGIYADGYIVFAFPFVHSYVR